MRYPSNMRILGVTVARTGATALCASLVIAAAFLPNVARSERHEIVIFHTSDVHGGYDARPARHHKAAPDRLIGGYAVLANLVKRETRPKILLDSGDIFQGTPEGNLTLGDASIALMNHLGYAAMVIGNHEYDYGEENLRRLEKLAKFPMLAANIFLNRDGRPVDYATPHHMVTVGGVKVGILGLATRHTATAARSITPRRITW